MNPLLMMGGISKVQLALLRQAEPPPGLIGVDAGCDQTIQSVL